MKYSFFIILVWTVSVFAQTTIEHTQMTQSSLQEIQKQTADVWGLSVAEWGQYKELERQFSGLISADISPLEWLGIFAKTPEKRKYYAKLFAERQLEVTEAISKFETEYISAMNELVLKRDSGQLQKRILLVTPYNCTNKSCKDNLNLALQHVIKGGALDIVIQERVSNLQLRNWTTTHQIPAHLLRTRRITVTRANSQGTKFQNGIFEIN